MGANSTHSILVVDDNATVGESFSMLLKYGGYKVDTAIHGLDAINKLRFSVPDLILSDLDMPEMSGFEFLSVVRHSFPQIPVIAMTGMAAYDNQLPDGVIADGFYRKGRSRPDELLLMAANLISTPPGRPGDDLEQADASQQPHYEDVPNELTSMLLTCPDCLRDLPIESVDRNPPELLDTQCPSCMTMFRYERGICLTRIHEPHAVSVSQIGTANSPS